MQSRVVCAQGPECTCGIYRVQYSNPRRTLSYETIGLASGVERGVSTAIIYEMHRMPRFCPIIVLEDA